MAVFIILAAKETKYVGRQKNIRIFLTTVNHSINKEEESCGLLSFLSLLSQCYTY